MLRGKNASGLKAGLRKKRAKELGKARAGAVGADDGGGVSASLLEAPSTAMIPIEPRCIPERILTDAIDQAGTYGIADDVARDVDEILFVA